MGWIIVTTCFTDYKFKQKTIHRTNLPDQVKCSFFLVHNAGIRDAFKDHYVSINVGGGQ